MSEYLKKIIALYRLTGGITYTYIYLNIYTDNSRPDMLNNNRRSVLIQRKVLNVETTQQQQRLLPPPSPLQTQPTMIQRGVWMQSRFEINLKIVYKFLFKSYIHNQLSLPHVMTRGSLSQSQSLCCFGSFEGMKNVPPRKKKTQSNYNLFYYQTK